MNFGINESEGLERLEYDTRLWSLALLFVHFFQKVGKDKEKDSLELWLNTFFLSRDIEDFGFALFILPWD